jgi:hypothetical protein
MLFGMTVGVVVAMHALAAVTAALSGGRAVVQCNLWGLSVPFAMDALAALQAAALIARLSPRNAPAAIEAFNGLLLVSQLEGVLPPAACAGPAGVAWSAYLMPTFLGFLATFGTTASAVLLALRHPWARYAVSPVEALAVPVLAQGAAVLACMQIGGSGTVVCPSGKPAPVAVAASIVGLVCMGFLLPALLVWHRLRRRNPVLPSDFLPRRWWVAYPLLGVRLLLSLLLLGGRQLSYAAAACAALASAAVALMVIALAPWLPALRWKQWTEVGVQSVLLIGAAMSASTSVVLMWIVFVLEMVLVAWLLAAFVVLSLRMVSHLLQAESKRTTVATTEAASIVAETNRKHGFLSNIERLVEAAFGIVSETSTVSIDDGGNSRAARVSVLSIPSVDRRFSLTPPAGEKPGGSEWADEMHANETTAVRRSVLASVLSVRKARPRLLLFTEDGSDSGPGMRDNFQRRDSRSIFAPQSVIQSGKRGASNRSGWASSVTSADNDQDQNGDSGTDRAVQKLSPLWRLNSTFAAPATGAVMHRDGLASLKRSAAPPTKSRLGSNASALVIHVAAAAAAVRVDRDDGDAR